MDAFEARFDAELMDFCRQAESEIGYTSKAYVQALAEHRGVEMARSLLRAPTASEEYTALAERGRLDLTIEALVYDYTEFHALFSDDERETARRRLMEYNYPPALDPLEPFIGAFHSGIPNWSIDHDRYLGQALFEEMRGIEHKRS